MFVSKVLRKEYPVELIWSEPNQFESLFNLQWPQREITQIRLFDRPNQINRIHGGLNQQVYITGRFNLTQQFLDSDIDLTEFELYSLNQLYATVQIVGMKPTFHRLVKRFGGIAIFLRLSAPHLQMALRVSIGDDISPHRF